MAERPFMQFYGSDFVGDTMLLSAEQIGAYMLLLIAMWNAHGRLPNDPKKLARAARVTVARWQKLAPDLMPFFEHDELEIWHKRMQKNLKNLEKKSAQNRESGAKGGRAKALKDKEADLANATISPQRKATIARATPEPEPELEEESSLRSQKKTARGSRLPTDWEIPNEWGRWAVEEFGVGSGAVRAEAAKFRDYWCAKAGAQATKLDWLATWRNWCRTAFAPKSGAPRSSRPKSAAELASELLAEMEQADERNAEAERNHPPAGQHAITGPR